MSHLELRHAARTDVGRLRSHNEDAFLAVPEAGAFAVADGLGGHAAGEVASGLAIHVLGQRFAGNGAAASSGPGLREALAEAIREANARIRRSAGADASLAGMGTTLTALLLEDGRYLIGHVGDSRAYLLRSGKLRRLTRDHTYVQEMVEGGRLTDEEARRHPRSSLLTRALGIEADVEVSMYEGEARPGDRYLLATDGLTGMVSEQELRALVSRGEELETVAHGLVDAANAAGGTDNITVVVVDFGGSGLPVSGRPEPPAQ